MIYLQTHGQTKEDMRHRLSRPKKGGQKWRLQCKTSVSPIHPIHAFSTMRPDSVTLHSIAAALFPKGTINEDKRLTIMPNPDQVSSSWYLGAWHLVRYMAHLVTWRRWFAHGRARSIVRVFCCSTAATRLNEEAIGMLDH